MTQPEKNELTAAVWLSTYEDKQKLLLLRIAYFLRLPDGYADLGQSKLARYCNCSERHIKRVVRTLKADGVLGVQLIKEKAWHNRYALNLAALMARQSTRDLIQSPEDPITSPVSAGGQVGPLPDRSPSVGQVATPGGGPVKSQEGVLTVQSKEGKKESASADLIPDETPVEPRTEPPTPAKEWKPKYAKAEDVPETERAFYLTRRLFKCLGCPKHHEGNLRDWETELTPLVHQFDFPEMYNAIRWATVEDTNWPQYIRRPKNLVDNAEKIVDAYRAHLRGKATHERTVKQPAQAIARVKVNVAPSNYGTGKIELQGGEKL